MSETIMWKRMYTTLVMGIDAALTHLGQGKVLEMEEDLRRVLEEAEELYIEAEGGQDD